MRLVGKPMEIFQYLEPLYNDYRKIARRTALGFELLHIDEFVDELLTSDFSCNVSLPHLPKRLVSAMVLPSTPHCVCFPVVGRSLFQNGIFCMSGL